MTEPEYKGSFLEAMGVSEEDATECQCRWSGADREKMRRNRSTALCPIHNDVEPTVAVRLCDGKEEAKLNAEISRLRAKLLEAVVISDEHRRAAEAATEELQETAAKLEEAEREAISQRGLKMGARKWAEVHRDAMRDLRSDLDMEGPEPWPLSKPLPWEPTPVGGDELEGKLS